MIAGGKDVVTTMGDRGVNSSIGSQWKDRVAELDEAAKNVPEAERGGTKMNAKLKRCK
ncbi:polymorphic toxin type 15 domain-containing protein [Burkholderia cepacia]|uniref:polymorphic toxin type 15 domain-containing protein n=1 Tax=Burkholderia cepacia TaxID=292 RepID=UPI0034555754